jgi:ATP-binding cassette subfamily B protein
MSKKIHDESGRVQERAALVASQAQESFAGVRVVRAFLQERAEVESFRRVNHELVRRNEKLIDMTAAYYPTLRFLVATGFLGTFWYGGLLTLRHEISVGQFVQFILYTGKSRPPPSRIRLGRQSLPARHGLDGAHPRNHVGQASR